MLDSMRYMYQCGACRTISSHPSERAARVERADHAERVHDGRWHRNDDIIGIRGKPRPVGGYVLGWLDRHNWIIGRALLQFVGLFVAAGLLYRLFTAVFG